MVQIFSAKEAFVSSNIEENIILHTLAIKLVPNLCIHRKK